MTNTMFKSSLTQEQEAELKKKVADDIAIIRHQVLCKFPFTGSILMKLNTIPVRDVRLNTACTDGTNIYVDIDFYHKLSKDERIFVFAHEVWHSVLLHCERLQSRDMRIFNYAADMELNNILKAENIHVPEFALLPPKHLVNKSAEIIYDYLIDQAKKNNKNNSKKGNNSNSANGNSGNSSNNNSGDSSNSKSDNSAAGNSGNSSDSNSDDSSNSKSNNSAAGNSSNSNTSDFKNNNGQFDKHIYHNNENEQLSNNGEIKDSYGTKGIDKDYNPAIDPNITNNMREAILATAEIVERTKGDIPDCIVEYINRLKTPEISWKEVLNRYITQCYSGERKFGPFNRRHIYNGLYLPSQRTERINVGLLIDTSGSCGQDFAKFYTEFTNLLNSMGNYHAHIIQCDAKVQSYNEYDSKDNPFDTSKNSYSNYKFNGLGGSDFRPAFEFIRKKNIEFDILCCFTDLYIDIPRHKQPYPVLWVVPKTGSNEKPAWGQYLKMNEN